MPFPPPTTDLRTQVDAVRRSCGVCDLSRRGLLRVEGRDRETFLQGMVSNDVRLPPGAACYATLLEPKGHMLADMTLYAFSDAYLADTEPGMAAFIAKTLDRYLIREKVTLTVEDAKWASIGVSGLAAQETLNRVLPDLAPLPGPFSGAIFTWNGAEGYALRRDFTGKVSVMLLIPPDTASALWVALTAAGAIVVGEEAVETLRVEAGIPVFGVDMTREQIPLEAALTFGINRNKGCYVGQEIIERMSSRGHANRRLVPLRFGAGPTPPVGSRLRFEGKEMGAVTSAVASHAAGTPLGMGYVRAAAFAPGTPVEVVFPDDTASTAEVLARPEFGSGEPPAIVNPGS